MRPKPGQSESFPKLFWFGSFTLCSNSRKTLSLELPVTTFPCINTILKKTANHRKDWTHSETSKNKGKEEKNGTRESKNERKRKYTRGGNSWHFVNSRFQSYLKHVSLWTSQLHGSVHCFFLLNKSKFSYYQQKQSWSLQCQGGFQQCGGEIYILLANLVVSLGVNETHHGFSNL